MKFKLIVLSLVMLCGFRSVPVMADEPFVRSHTQNAVKKSTDVVLAVMPVVTLAGVLIERDWKGLVQGCETAAATLGATYILKYAVKERRPDGSDFHSFPSGHTSATFATAAFVQRRYGWKFGIPAYALSTYVAWGRCFARRHHVWDVVAGAAIGAGAAYIFTTPYARTHNMALVPVTDGESLGVSFSMNF